MSQLVSDTLPARSLAPGSDSAVSSDYSLDLTVIVPIYNEVGAVEGTVRQLHIILNSVPRSEFVCVDDGSTDGTTIILTRLAEELPGLQIYRHERNHGYGAALKLGIRKARGRLIAITDADGTYPNDRIPELAELCKKADMVVGARIGDGVVYSKVRAIPKYLLVRYSEWMTRSKIPDLNSGLRVFRADVVHRFIGILPDTFSFTTTLTIGMLMSSHVLRFEPITYKQRVGRSKIAPVRDTLRFFQLVLRTSLYFAPLRVLAPFISLAWLGFLLALINDIWNRFNLADKTVILFVLASNLTIIGLLADLIDKRAQR